MVESEQDRMSLLKDFGLPVQLKRGAVTYKYTTGILDKTPQLFDQGDGTAISTYGTTLIVSASAVDGVQQDDIAVVSGKSFQIIDVQDDATGILVLNLQRAS